MRLTQAGLDAVDLERLRSYVSSHEEFYGPNQHYRLLAYLSNLLAPSETIIDIGTHLGDSAVALSYGGRDVLTFDVVEKIGDRALPTNVRRHTVDLTQADTRQQLRNTLLSSALIFIDIDPHEGTREYELIEWLRTNCYAGIMVLDDIWYFDGTREKLWRRIAPEQKIDVTAIGHWAGTGIVSFVEPVELEAGLPRLLPLRPDNDGAVAYVSTLPTEGLAQLEILKSLGCKPHHRVLEIGCGALVAGFPIMQYLDAGNYSGVDPNVWLIEQSKALPEVAAVVAEKHPRFHASANFRASEYTTRPDGNHERAKFDFIISHSILSHASNTQLTDFLNAAREQLAPGGTLAASIRLAEGNEHGSPGSAQHGADFAEWQYPGVSWFKSVDVLDRAHRAGLMAKVAPELTRKILVGNPKAIHDWVVARPTKVTLVTGFFRLRDRQVDEDAQFALFDQLAAGCGHDILLFLDQDLMDRAPKRPNVRVIPTTFEQLWTFRWAEGRELDLPSNRTPEKDTRDFLLLQNSKLDMLELAVTLDDSSTHFAWIDFGVLKIARDPWRFLQKLQALKPTVSCVLAPGCWSKGFGYNGVNWRFCGGFLLADRQSVLDLSSAARSLVEDRDILTWEVNNWAELELQGQHFDWYKADHDDTLIPSDEPRICLVMIVKNESKIIERCLTGALPFIDSWCITDTGSTDGTEGQIEKFFREHSVPGKIARAKFEDFAQARNASLDAARVVPGWDYALLIDADMVVEGALDKRSLTAPAYHVVQYDGTKEWVNVRLLKRDAPARYVSVTHEFLSVEGVQDISSLRINDVNDGGSKSNKVERDIRLLTEGLQKEPNNGRYMFYLAQTYRETDRPHRALPWYKKRISVDGWDEEIYYSHYGIALCYKELDDEPNFIRACLDAYNYRPWRGESLNLLATYYRERGKNESAMLIAEGLSKIKFTGEKLFMSNEVYDFGANQEFAIAGFHSRITERRDVGYNACALLTTHPNEAVRRLAQRNFTHYAKPASALFGAETRQIQWTPPEAGWAPMNPSVFVSRTEHDSESMGGFSTWHDTRRLVLVRTVNYVIADGQYPTNDGSGIIRTINYILEMDASWNPIKSTPIRDNTGTMKNDFPVQGFEDCRLWETESSAYSASTTVRDLADNPAGAGHHEMAIIKLDREWRADYMTVVRDYHHREVQKNWMPIVGRPGAFLYLCHPTIAIEVSDNGRTTEIARHLTAGSSDSDRKVSFADLRGGSQLIPHAGGWLCLTHEVTWRPERVYLHRFLAFDADFKIIALSDPFYFERVGIEFCAGLARDGEKLVASYGVNDASAHLAFFDPSKVESALKAL